MSNLWPKMQSDEQFMRHFPNKLPKNRLPDREYFFTVLNTVHEDFTQKMIKHANEQRNSSVAATMQQESILITQNMFEKLNEFPYISCKFTLNTNFLLARKGKTVYLLKQKAMPVLSKKRRKVEVLAMQGQ